MSKFDLTGFSFANREDEIDVTSHKDSKGFVVSISRESDDQGEIVLLRLVPDLFCGQHRICNHHNS